MVNETQSIRVPTIMGTKSKGEDIDLDMLDEGDLESLKTKDPFMYHSIPGIHKARLSFGEVDHSTVLDDASREANTKVSRKSRLTTESDGGLALLGGLLLSGVIDDDDAPVPPEQITASSEANDDANPTTKQRNLS
ncbi:hypothetical protein ACHAW5_001235 [Stephanodiscus triporus]|uniref:Uncharacterized protein n=1 Tax=Stephanodiscus triporus TaxID=2934178 RepID=A0ABD3NLP8_9STRA